MSGAYRYRGQPDWDPARVVVKKTDTEHREAEAAVHELEHAALVNRVRLQLVPERPAAMSDERCRACGYRLQSRGHAVSCM